MLGWPSWGSPPASTTSTPTFFGQGTSTYWGAVLETYLVVETAGDYKFKAVVYKNDAVELKIDGAVVLESTKTNLGVRGCRSTMMAYYSGPPTGNTLGGSGCTGLSAVKCRFLTAGYHHVRAKGTPTTATRTDSRSTTRGRTRTAWSSWPTASSAWRHYRRLHRPPPANARAAVTARSLRPAAGAATSTAGGALDIAEYVLVTAGPNGATTTCAASGRPRRGEPRRVCLIAAMGGQPSRICIIHRKREGSIGGTRRMLAQMYFEGYWRTSGYA